MSTYGYINVSTPVYYGVQVMIRLVDDFLLVTKSTEVATRFFDVMTRGIYTSWYQCVLIIDVAQGIPEYNCFINVNKTVKNFEIAEGSEAKISTEGTYSSICLYVQSLK